MVATQTTKPRPIIQYQERTAPFFPEEALVLEPDQLMLEMVQIPPGSFVMGSPEVEQSRFEDEGPQHEVKISEPFFLGKYPVTQAQWQAVAALPQLKRKLNANPSHFEGDNRPVEQVSWLDAVEFCQRLEQVTHRPYRLPSEAEWEYACRAGTTEPFHFGTSIITDLANYRGTDLVNEGKTYSGAYGNGPHGEYREQTTDVDLFDIANAFGICDMHGNVWEWCQDRWHDNYDGAPTDRSAWVIPSAKAKEENRVLRGGSWYFNHVYCRSSSRGRYAPDVWDFDTGFRVVCGGAKHEHPSLLPFLPALVL